MAQQSDKLRLLRRIPDIRFEEESRGYSKDQVDRVLANLAPLADEIERMQARLAEAENRAASAETRLVEARSPSQAPVPPGAPPAPMPDFDETLRNTLVNAQRTADTTVREAKEEAERLRNEAEFQSNALLADARDQATEMTTEAVAQRERLLAEAAAERAKMLEAAKDEAQQRVTAVEDELAQAHESERNKLLDQITELQQVHGLLQSDVTRFEEHLEARRTDVKSALEQLNAVLDDPELLRSREALEPADIGVIDSNDYPPVAVEVVALDELEAEAQAALEETTRPDEAVSPDELEELAPANESAGELVEAVDERELEPPEVHMEVVDDEDDLVVYQEPAMERLDHQAERLDHQAERLDHQAERVDHQAERVEHRERIEHVEQQHQPHQQPPPAEMISNGGGGPIDQGPPPPTGDPFLDELRRVTTEEPTDGDPITDFLEEDGTNRGSGWFGRKR